MSSVLFFFLSSGEMPSDHLSWVFCRMESILGTRNSLLLNCRARPEGEEGAPTIPVIIPATSSADGSCSGFQQHFPFWMLKAPACALGLLANFDLACRGFVLKTAFWNNELKLWRRWGGYPAAWGSISSASRLLWLQKNEARPSHLPQLTINTT